MTDARNALSQLTQLPAAAQLAGEARAQVSQLISNFNELITTQGDWHANYAKVVANLNTLIGPDNSAAERPGDPPVATTGATPPAGAAGIAGAVGTSGTMTPALSLDPTIRAKLVELRTHLQAFEKASGSVAPMEQESALRHIEALEEILNGTGAAATGTGGPSAASSPLTLDRAQLDQLRSHLTELKKLVEVEKK